MFPSLIVERVFSFFFHSQPPHLPSLGDSTPAFQVPGGGGGFKSAQPCVCSLWRTVCVNTEPSARTHTNTHKHTLVFGQCVKWRGERQRDRESILPGQAYSECLFISLKKQTHNPWTESARARGRDMAAPTKFSFSVRSILDLPELETVPGYSSCSSSSPYSSWMDCDRSPCICKCTFEAILVVMLGFTSPPCLVFYFMYKYALFGHL